MSTTCTKCGAVGYTMPLHGERGGPLFCFMCAGAWHAEHGRKRRAGRVVVKALRAYEEAGGSIYGKDFNELKLAAGGMFVIYESDTAGADFRDLTSELLAAAIALTHPDKHPPERKAEANRVTQELQALKPFVFPAPEPEPPKPPPKRDGCLKESTDYLSKPSHQPYPCEDCRDAIPLHYCDPCKAEYEKRQQQECEREEKRRQRKNARQRQLYKLHNEWRQRHLAEPIACITCGEKFWPKRSDAKYCSAACRQRAYVKRDGKASNFKPQGPEQIARVIAAAFTANQDSAFTTDELCHRVYAGLKQIERKTPCRRSRRRCERLHWDWFQAEWRGGTSIFWNRVSVTSYALARFRLNSWNRDASEGDLKNKLLSPDNQKLITKGGTWWQHVQDDIAELKQTTANQNNDGGNLRNCHAEPVPEAAS
jgi:hypothetical protein